MRSFQISLLLSLFTLSVLGQNIKAEYLYIRQINAQDKFLIEDNLPNALCTLDSILYSFPQNSVYAADFVEELGNSYFNIGEYEISIFFYLIEGSLFQKKTNQNSLLNRLHEAYEQLAINNDIQLRINSIPKINPNITSPLILVKYLNSKSLNPIILRYIQNLRERNTPIPNEIQLWVKLHKYKIPTRIRTKYFTTNFNQLNKKEKRRYYRKGTHYFQHIGNKSKAEQYIIAYNKNSTSISHKLCSLILKIKNLCINK